MDALIEFDRWLLFLINGIHSPFLDEVFYLISNKLIWIPLYVFFGYLLIKHYGRKSGIVLILGTIMTVGSVDLICAKVIKPQVGRYRPSHNTEINSNLHFYTNSEGHEYRGGKYGFVSNHSANSFALATFLFIFLRRKIKRFTLYIFLWASIVAISRIYLGVHYPTDIVGGVLIGMSIASLFAILALVFVLKIENKTITKES